MTIEELEDTLPSGFHDARLRRIDVNFAQATCVLDLEVDFGDFDKLVRVFVTGVILCVLEPEDIRTFGSRLEGSRVDGFPTTERMWPSLNDYRSMAPANAFFYSFFLNANNSFLHLAGTGAKLDILETLPADQ